MSCVECGHKDLVRIGKLLNLNEEMFLHIQGVLPPDTWLCDGCWDYHQSLYNKEW